MPKMPSWFKPGMTPDEMTDEQKAEMKAIFQKMGPPGGGKMGPPNGMKRPRKSKDDPSFGVMLPSEEGEQKTENQFPDGDFPPPPDGGDFPPPPPSDGAAPPPPPSGGGGGPGPGGPPPM